MIIAWVLAFVMYLASMILIGNSATGAIISIAIGASSAISVFLFSLLRSVNRNAFAANNSLPR